MTKPEDMVEVDGRWYRPEDVPGKAGDTAESADGKTVAIGPVTPARMVDVDGVLYRPEDVPEHAKGGEADKAADKAAAEAAEKEAADKAAAEAAEKEAAVKAEADEKAKAVTTKAAQPRNKARTPRSKK